MAQSSALGRPFDQPGDVGENELAAVDFHDPEAGFEGGERIVGDLGTGRRYPGDEGRLAGVGEAHEGGVGHQFQFEDEPPLRPVLTLLGDGRGPHLR